jgi:hypothetical protein
MHIRSWFCAVTVCLMAVAAPAGGFQDASRPTAHAAKTCSVPQYPGDGYFTSLSVKHVSCKTGRSLALAYYHCRIKHGRAGKCQKARVMHFRCHEVRMSIPTELDARVTCKRGGKRVVHSYQQNL